MLRRHPRSWSGSSDDIAPMLSPTSGIRRQEGAKLQQRIESFYPPDGLRARLLARPDS